MKKQTFMIGFLCIGFSFGLLLSGCKRSEEPGSESSNAAQKAKEEIKAAAGATGDYLTEQKDKFMKEAKENYANLETQTNQLIADLKSDTSEKWQQTKADLSEKMQAVQTKLDEVAKKSGRAWEESKGDLSDALDNLKKAYEKAKAEFQKENSTM